MTETTYFCNQIAAEFGVSQKVAYNVITLLNEGATIPFIARYRKEMTNTMDEKTIADINKRIKQLAELDKRKEFVLKSIAEQEKLTPELEEQIKMPLPCKIWKISIFHTNRNGVPKRK